MTEHHKTSSEEKAGLALLLMVQGLQYLSATGLPRASAALSLEMPRPPTAEMLRKAAPHPTTHFTRKD